MTQDRKPSQEYPGNAGVPLNSLFVLYVNDCLDDVILNIAIYADVTDLYSRCDHVSYLWQQLELASKLESDLRDTGLGQKVAC